MDYPKTVQGVGLVDGKFVNENPATGQVGSLIPAEWGNSVTDEILNVIQAAGMEPSEQATNQLIQAIRQLAAIGSPTGMIAFIHDTDVPDGWLLCNGAAVSRTEYAALFAKIGVKYGSGDGSTTFNLPNLDGRVLQGTTNIGQVGNYLEASLPNIQGSLYSQPYGENRENIFVWTSGSFSSNLSGSTGRGSLTINNDVPGSTLSYLSFDADKSSSVYNGSAMQPRALQVLACIRI